MFSHKSNGFITIRAAIKSYVILCGVWVLLAVGYLFLSLRNPGNGIELGVIITGGIALLWCVWLRGFKIVIGDKYIEYRDGFFRSSKILFKEIVDVQAKSIEWNILTRKIRISRIAVIAKSRKIVMLINPKPFGCLEMRQLINVINQLSRD